MWVSGLYHALLGPAALRSHVNTALVSVLIWLVLRACVQRGCRASSIVIASCMTRNLAAHRMRTLLLLSLVAALFPACLAEDHWIPWGFDTRDATMRVDVNDTVIWIWGVDVEPHSLVSGVFPANDGLFGVSTPQTEGNYSVMFTEVGVYPYYCGVHLPMTATIVVVDGKRNSVCTRIGSQGSGRHRTSAYRHSDDSVVRSSSCKIHS